MAQSQAQDYAYALPTPSGNTGPNTDLEQNINANGVAVIRQRMAACITGTNMQLTPGQEQVVSPKPGALLCAVVISAGEGANNVTFYDNTAANGVIVGVVPANAPLGSRWPFNIPLLNGLFADMPAGCPGVTVAWQT